MVALQKGEGWGLLAYAPSSFERKGIKECSISVKVATRFALPTNVQYQRCMLSGYHVFTWTHRKKLGLEPDIIALATCTQYVAMLLLRDPSVFHQEKPQRAKKKQTHSKTRNICCILSVDLELSVYLSCFFSSLDSFSAAMEFSIT